MRWHSDTTPGEHTAVLFWVAVKELSLSHHNVECGYIEKIRFLDYGTFLYKCHNNSIRSCPQPASVRPSSRWQPTSLGAPLPLSADQCPAREASSGSPAGLTGACFGGVTGARPCPDRDRGRGGVRGRRLTGTGGAVASAAAGSLVGRIIGPCPLTSLSLPPSQFLKNRKPTLARP